MNLLDLMVKIGVDDKASDKINGISNGIKGTLSGAAKAVGGVMLAVGTAAAAGAVAIGKAALDSYAQYEQLVGGVETLFGTRGAASVEEYAQITGQSLEEASKSFQEHQAAQEAVFENADSAYKRAGVSANRYMEQATSFSASLVSSLGGDVTEAARLADTAIVDMADNANKMGTDLGRIQDAYQGFAKQNYTMLDNLKLGYGGTKTEMERLLQDAERIKAAHGEMADYSIDSFADVVEAIHVVQEEMGVTGTTAEEAEHTISGSVGMMKSAWEDWLTALGRDDVDISQYTSRLLDSIGTVADNVGPRLQIIATTMLRELPGVFAQVIEQVPGMLKGFGSAIADGLEDAGFEDAANVVRGLGDAIEDAFSWINENGDLIAFILGSIAGALGAFMAYQGIVALIQGIATAFGILNAVMAANPIVLIVGLLAMLVGGFIALMATNETFRNHVIEIWNAVVTTVSGAVQGIVGFFSNLWGAVNTFMTNFPQLLVTIGTVLAGALQAVVTWVSNMASNAIQAGSRFLSGVANGISQVPGRVGSFLASVISRVASWVGQMASNATNAASRFASNLISGLSSIPGRVASIGSQIISGMVGGVQAAAGRLIGAVQGVVGGAIGAAKSLLGIASPSKVFRQLGVYTMQGMTQGLESEGRSTERSMAEIAERVYAAASGSATVGLGADFGAAAEATRDGSAGLPPKVEINFTGDMIVRSDYDIRAISDRLGTIITREIGGSVWRSSSTTGSLYQTYALS